MNVSIYIYTYVYIFMNVYTYIYIHMFINMYRPNAWPRQTKHTVLNSHFATQFTSTENSFSRLTFPLSLPLLRTHSQESLCNSIYYNDGYSARFYMYYIKRLQS